MQSKKNKILYIFSIAMIILLAILGIIVDNLKKNDTVEENNNIEDNNEIITLKELIEKLDCTYKKSKNSSEDGFEYDIYLIFKYDLYDEDSNNKDFYYDCINKIAEFLNYENFRLIDKSREEEILIEVTCDNSDVQKIIINGMEDYFIYNDSQKELSGYKEYSTSDFNIVSRELKECIEKNWSNRIEFGSRESIFNNYYIYFDEGIEVKTIGKKIYNVIFTNKYQSEIIENIKVGMDKSTIKAFIGTPTYSNDDESIIGYKTEKYYIFFEENQISVYRNDNFETYDEFYELVNKYLNEEYNLKKFMNELTYLWSDYSEYDYDSDYIFISYPNKGIEIKINYENTNGIIFYNNIGSDKNTITKYLENTNFVAKLSIDGVFEAEKRRVNTINSYNSKCNEFYEKNEVNDSRNKGDLYDYFAKFDNDNTISNMYFISKNDGYFNCQLNETIDSYYWYNEYTLLYSKKYSGIYYYNLVRQEKGIITTGEDDEYVLKSITEDGWIDYDNKSVKIN